MSIIERGDGPRAAGIGSRNLAVGVPVRSTTTRGKNVGVVGVVAWYGVDRHASTVDATRYRVGIRVPGEPVLRYMPADKVEVINAAPVDRKAAARRPAGRTA